MGSSHSTPQLFAAALGLQPPWEVVEALLDRTVDQLRLTLDFARGARFACPACGTEDCPVHDTEARRWRQTSFSMRAISRPVSLVYSARAVG